MKPELRSAALVDDFLRGRLNRRDLLRRAAALGVSAPVIAALDGIGVRSAFAQAATGGGNKAKGPKVDKLVLWTRSSPDATDNTEWMHITNVANAYTQQVGTKIELVTVPDKDFKNKMAVSAPNGQGPDVFGPIAHDWLGEFAVQGIALEVPDSAIDNKADFNADGFALCTIDDKLYAMPLFLESVALIYNTAMVPKPPTTWADLVSMATGLTKGNVYGFGFPLLEQYHEGGFFMGLGSYIFKYAEGKFDTNDIGLDNAGGVAASEFLRDMYFKKQPPMPSAAIDRKSMHTVQEGMMEQSQLAMTINGPWREAPLTKAGIKFGVAKLPTLPNGQPMKPFIGVQAWVANAYGKNKDAALDFLSFATGTDSAVELFKAFNKVPVRQSALQSPALADHPTLSNWAAQLKDGVPMPNIPAMSGVWTPWGDAMDAIIPRNTGNDQIKPLLDSAVTTIKKNIKDIES